MATLLATVVHLQAASIDDCLELFDLLMVTELLGKAEREADKQRAREHPRLARASVKLAAAVGKLLDAAGSGQPVDFGEVWEQIEQVVPESELRAAVRHGPASWCRSQMRTMRARSASGSRSGSGWSAASCAS